MPMTPFRDCVEKVPQTDPIFNTNMEDCRKKFFSNSKKNVQNTNVASKISSPAAKVASMSSPTPILSMPNMPMNIAMPNSNPTQIESVLNFPESINSILAPADNIDPQNLEQIANYSYELYCKKYREKNPDDPNLTKSNFPNLYLYLLAFNLKANSQITKAKQDNKTLDLNKFAVKYADYHFEPKMGAMALSRYFGDTFKGGYRKTRKNRMSKKQRKSKSRKSSKSRKQRRTTRKY